MIYFEELWIKFRYSHFLRPLFDAIARLGIRITTYYLFMEEIPPENQQILPDGLEDYEFCYWGPEDMEDVAFIQGRKFSGAFLAQRFKEGSQCIGLKKNNHPAIFSWYNLKKATFKYNGFPLKNDEAYIFDTLTLLDFRGKGLAPFLHFHLYKDLRKIGRRKLYSYVDYLNSPAVRLKVKLNAVRIKLYLSIDLFGKRQFHFTLKDYQK